MNRVTILCFCLLGGCFYDMLALDITPIEPSDCIELPRGGLDCKIDLLPQNNVYLSDVFFETTTTRSVGLTTFGIYADRSEIVLDDRTLEPGDEATTIIRCSKGTRIERIRLIPEEPNILSIANLRFRQLHR
jgi:hypothetical protein